MMNPIIDNLFQVKKRMVIACERTGRNPNEVKLLLATKTVPVNKIKIVLEAGETLIGENKVQELKEKFDSLKEYPHENHFIGHLQTNKIKDVIKCNVSCIQSVDRLDLAKKLHERLVFEQKKMNILIQVNTSGEESKFGVSPGNTINLIRKISQLETLQVKGLMTIGLFTTETEKVRRCFKLLKYLQQEIISQGIPMVEMNELSMGMSNDLEIAIEEGATMIRVGTSVFGQRIYPDSYYWNENR